ncbi:hypothetical protein C2E20_3443 [Micractinium conductrix]|uniref:Uncharacterized protein n=1 Tax=Micractinium conductrix TaxID=554055 RepID=A0A2P6VH77_9CHLO|nr:hypothetical protein C2E20_3443 [Micractinium conductrix]|eukprot:PSC73446.1 hypothetical protein C2E20_3443 [Micractinium conductrix]
MLREARRSRPSEGTALLPALHQAAALLETAREGGSPAAALLKAQDALWPAVSSFVSAAAEGQPSATAPLGAARRRLSAASAEDALIWLAQRTVSDGSTAASLSALHEIAAELSSPPGSKHGSGGDRRRLSEHSPHGLMPRLQQLGEARASLRSRLHDRLGGEGGHGVLQRQGGLLGGGTKGLIGQNGHGLLHRQGGGLVGGGLIGEGGHGLLHRHGGLLGRLHGDGGAPARRLQQDGDAGEDSEWQQGGDAEWAGEDVEWRQGGDAKWAGEGGEGPADGDEAADWSAEDQQWWDAPVLPSDMPVALPSDLVVVQEVQLAPLSSTLLTGILVLARDAVELALSASQPQPHLVALITGPAGYPAVYPQAAVLGGGWLEQGTAGNYGFAAGRRLQEQPPLPKGEPPAVVAVQDAASYYEDDSYSGDYSEVDAMYYAENEDWLFDDPQDLYILLASINASPAATLTLPTLALPPPVAADTPAATLPVFAVFASSSHAPAQPSTANASAGEPTKQKAVELVIAPLSGAARTTIPHTDAQPTGRQFDFTALSIAVTVACVGLLLGLLAVVRFWSARGNRDGNGDATERLLYSHIPGTPSRAINTASARAAMSSGARSVPASNGPVPKKLSNLPA